MQAWIWSRIAMMLTGDNDKLAKNIAVENFSCSFSAGFGAWLSAKSNQPKNVEKIVKVYARGFETLDHSKFQEGTVSIPNEDFCMAVN